MIYPNNMEREWVIVITWRISEECFHNYTIHGTNWRH